MNKIAAQLLICIGLVFVSGSAADIVAQTVEGGTFVLYKYQKQMGIESYEVKPDGDTLTLTANFKLSFIGGDFSLDTKLSYHPVSLSPLHFETKGKTSTRTTVDSTVQIKDDIATIRYDSKTESKKISGPFFTLLQPAPVAPQMMLFRFWKKHGIKGELPLLPGGRAIIQHHGTDVITAGGKKHKLERYSIDGVMWGRETVWFDSDQNLIALVGADAEMDRFEAVRKGFETQLPFFVRTAARDSVAHLEKLSRDIRPQMKGPFVIAGGLLVGGKGFATIQDSVIVIENGLIKSVGTRGDIAIPKGLKVFDATGKTILPGLFDTHAHATQSEWFPASLAAGITTMRDAANEIEFIVPIRDAVEKGTITVSPRVLLAGYIDSGESAVGSMKAETAEEARAIVNTYSKAGFQQIKVYQSLRPELVKVVTAEAHRLGMTVTGHVPSGMNIWEAIDNGFDQVNHLGFVFRIMSPSVIKEGETRNLDPDGELAKAGFQFLRENKIVIEPTLSRAEVGSKIFGDSFVSTDPGAEKLPFEFEALVKSMGVPAEQAVQRQARTELSLRVLKALHDAGVPLIIGTDLVIPGHTEYREFELFVTAGISPLDAIKSATIVPAMAMKLDERLGTIEEGKIADLIVLDANPLDSISNIRTVRFVVKSGSMFDTAPLWRSVNFRP